jgi:dsDNA-binding SOS-regulon protein
MTAVLKRIVVASYETTDGKTFTSKSEAQTHQRDLKRINELDALVKRGMSDGVTTVNDQMAAQIAAFILVYSDELRDILPKRSASAPAAVETPAPVPTQPVDNVPPAPTVEEVVQNGQLPVNPLAGVVMADGPVDAELAALVASLSVEAPVAA